MNNNVIKKQFDSIGSNFDIVPQYNVLNKNTLLRKNFF